MHSCSNVLRVPIVSFNRLRGLLIASFVLLTFCLTAQAGNVMTVNEDGISREEFLWFMEQERPAVFQFFYEHYKLTDGANFWNEVRDGITPRIMLLQNTIRRLTREKVEQGVFLTFGLTTDISYQVMLDQLAAVNQERLKAENQHKVLFGPVAFNQLAFYANWKSRLQLRAKEKMAAERLNLTDKVLRHFYFSHKQLFRSTDKWNLEIFSIDSLPPDQAASSDANFAAKEILQKTLAGQSAEQILQASDHSNEIKIIHERFDDLDRDRLGELFSNDNTLQKVFKLKAGQSILLSRPNGHVQVVRCCKKISADYLPFEQVRDTVKRRYLDKQYDEWVTSLSKSARVELNKKEMDSLLP